MEIGRFEMFLKSKTRLLRTAEKFALQGRFEQAIIHYLKVIQESPDDPNTLSVIGDLYTRLGQTKEAIRYYMQVADYYRNFNYLPKAIAIYRKVIQLEPTNFDLALMLANLCDEEGQKSDALRQYQDLAQKYQNVGDLENALNMLQKCIRLDPHNPYSLAQMGKILVERGEPESAETYLLDAADIFLQRGHKRQSHPLFLQIVESNLGNANALLGIIQSSTTTQDLAEAQELISKALYSNKIKDDQFLKNTLQEAWAFAAMQADNFEEARLAFNNLALKNEDLYAKDILIFLEKLIEKRMFEPALSCFKEAYPALIRRHESAAGLRLMREIDSSLQNIPDVKLIMAFFHQANNEKEKALENFHLAIDLFLAANLKQAALTAIESSLQLDPVPSHYWYLHEKVFRECYPDKAYVPPRIGHAEDAPVHSSLSTLTMSSSGSGVSPIPPEPFGSEYGTSVPTILHPEDHPTSLFPNQDFPDLRPDANNLLAGDEHPQEFSFTRQVADFPNSSAPSNPATLSPTPPVILSSPASPINGSKGTELAIEDEEGIFTLEIPDDQESFDSISGLDSAVQFSKDSSMGSSPGTDPSAFSEKAFSSDKSEMNTTSSEDAVVVFSEEDIMSTVDGFFAGFSDSSPKEHKLFDELFAKGIAYQEIGLIQDAINSFEYAFTLVSNNSLDSGYLNCCIHLSHCALAIRNCSMAIQYLTRALQTKNLDKSQQMALRYELATAYEISGDFKGAIQELEWSQAQEPGFRDVQARLKSLLK